MTFIRGVFTGNWKEAWNGVKKVFSSIVSGFAGIFKAPINAIISGINSFIGGINKIKIQIGYLELVVRDLIFLKFLNLLMVVLLMATVL